MPDFHDDFHGSALAHASLPVLQALDCSVGGCWRGDKGGGWVGGEGEGDEEKEEGVKDKEREEVMEGKGGEREKSRRKRRRRRRHTG